MASRVNLVPVDLVDPACIHRCEYTLLVTWEDDQGFLPFSHMQTWGTQHLGDALRVISFSRFSAQ
jgi:hypothetical protein